ncbi:glycerate kinase [Staphylococcus ratti]|uniref:Glycerate kinase n=1 Tax=Staphylococcus ratti TaxID=2892440 RepID=A0ABY3PBS1_9STAP|nr:glycerate kinase [Staphylococcus ratti]UEX89754.1 glycerate kinase [Staphylococcus ratti]
MKVLVAMDEFNGILSSYDANRYVEEAVASQVQDADIVQVPLFNGRHELLNSVFTWKSGTQYRITAHDAQMNEVEVRYGQTDDGLTVIQSEQFQKGKASYLEHTSYGLGEVIAHALNRGANNIAISVGGTDTYDGGAGMLQALGAVFYDDDGEQVDMRKGLGQIKHIRRIDTNGLHQGLKEAQFQILIDFDSKMYGKQSAILKSYTSLRISREEAVEIDNLLWYFSEIMKHELKLSLGQIERGGAGGGLAAIFKAMFATKIMTSHELVDRITGLENLVKQADLIIFGEGLNERDFVIDTSSLRIAELANQYNKVAVAICGTSEKFERYENQDVTAMFSVFDELPSSYPDFKLGVHLRAYVTQIIKLLQTTT